MVSGVSIVESMGQPPREREDEPLMVDGRDLKCEELVKWSREWRIRYRFATEEADFFGKWSHYPDMDDSLDSVYKSDME